MRKAVRRFNMILGTQVFKWLKAFERNVSSAGGLTWTLKRLGFSFLLSVKINILTAYNPAFVCYTKISPWTFTLKARWILRLSHPAVWLTTLCPQAQNWRDLWRIKIWRILYRNIIIFLNIVLNINSKRSSLWECVFKQYICLFAAFLKMFFKITQILIWK